MAGAPPPWVVLKFGGPSVATPERWAVIINEVKRVRAAGERPFLVVSALAQVTNRIGKAIDEALEDVAPAHADSSFSWIRAAHVKLAEGLGVASNSEGMRPTMELLSELERLLEGIRLTQEASERLRARLTSFGEQMSSHLGLLAVLAAGCPCVRLDATKLLHSTETPTQQNSERFLNALVYPKKDPELVKAELTGSVEPPAKCRKTEGDLVPPVVITQGFIASTPQGDACLLGKGGSDISASLFAALLEAKRVEIWNADERGDGLHTSDPQIVKNTRVIGNVGYRVGQELATMGAWVLHPRCLIPAAWGNIPVEIHSTANPRGPCTSIFGGALEDLAGESTDGKNGAAGSGSTSKAAGCTNDKDPRVLAVTQRRGQVLINIENLCMWGEAGFLSRAFAPFSELGVSIDLVATSQYAVTLTLDHIPGGVNGEVFAHLCSKLDTLGSVTKHEPCAVVSVVGEHLRHALPELGSALEELRQRDVYLMTQSSEDLNLSFVVDERQAESLVQGLHSRLFPSLESGNAAKTI